MTMLPKVKLKAVVSFPATVLNGTGIDVVKSNGNFQFNLDFGDFAPPVGSLPDPTHQNALLWNSVTGSYILVPASVLVGASGLPDAPNDGVQYGRQSLGWTPIPISAPLASPVFTGDPKAPTPTPGDNDTSIATTAFVAAAITASGGVTPSALTRVNDTNITLTLGGTPATAVLQATSITVGWAGTLGAARGGFGADVSASSGVPLFAAGVATFTGSTGTGNFARVASPVFTGDPQAPTATAGDNDTSIATTAFVTNAVGTATVAPATVAPLMNGVAAVGVSLLYARQDHVHASDTTKGDFSSNTATSVDGEVILFSGTTGKLGKRATGTGITKITAGVQSVAVAGTDFMHPGTTSLITVGFTFTPNNIGTVSTGTMTPNPALGNYQFYTNNGAHTLAAPANDCAMDILVTNGATAGLITFSGFTVGSNTGEPLTTTNTNKFVVSIRRINAVATYTIKALQ